MTFRTAACNCIDISMPHITAGAQPQYDLRLLLRHEPPVRPRNLGRGLRQEQGGQGGREIQTDARDALQLDVLGVGRHFISNQNKI